MTDRRRPSRPWVGVLLYPAAAVSLAASLAGGGMWARSHHVSDRCGWGTSRTEGADRVLRSLDAWSAKGGVGVYVEAYRNAAFDRGAGSPWFHATDGSMDYPYVSVVPAGVADRRWAWGGFAVARATRGRDDLWMEMDGTRSAIADAQVSTSVVLPWWSVAAAGAVLPATAGRRLSRERRRRRRAKSGLCTGCGYDLRASPGRCPECGDAAPQFAPEDS